MADTDKSITVNKDKANQNRNDPYPTPQLKDNAVEPKVDKNKKGIGGITKEKESPVKEKIPDKKQDDNLKYNPNRSYNPYQPVRDHPSTPSKPVITPNQPVISPPTITQKPVPQNPFNNKVRQKETTIRRGNTSVTISHS